MKIFMVRGLIVPHAVDSESTWHSFQCYVERQLRSCIIVRCNLSLPITQADGHETQFGGHFKDEDWAKRVYKVSITPRDRT